MSITQAVTLNLRLAQSSKSACLKSNVWFQQRTDEQNWTFYLLFCMLLYNREIASALMGHVS